MFGNAVRVKKSTNIGRAYRIIKNLNVALKKCFNVVSVINGLGTNVVSIHIWVLFIKYLHKQLMFKINQKSQQIGLQLYNYRRNIEFVEHNFL